MPNEQIKTESLELGLARLGILLLLCAWLFWPQIALTARLAPASSETSHTLVAPLALGLLIFLRRRALAGSVSSGSLGGLLPLVGGLLLHAAAFWPFRYGYAHMLAIVVVLGGAVLSCCGWRTLRLSAPVLLLLWLALPIGSRIHATLVLRPNTWTVAAASAIIDRLPGVESHVAGADLLFSRNGEMGIVALGYANRGARLLFAYAAIFAFVAFSQVRSPRRLVLVAVAALPVVLLCNLLRLLCWSVIVVFGDVEPAGRVAPCVSAVVSLLSAYALSSLLCCFRPNLFVCDEPGIRTGGETRVC